MEKDEEVENLSCWSDDLKPVGELSRLCVKEDFRNHGIAKQMMEHAFEELRKQEYKGVHILVKKDHKVALQSYSHLNFKQVGTCKLYEKDFYCYERAL